ncbi:hypothetical protein M422DRAFT_37206 [Sphaerobolus stellatus SS14]|uniref:Uncharacterized protein n=1 Tax=Sphaerobolus stellatus (strain SS14) TaxID=990650 RepID=A0A0C9TH67_SPHS4|nr:hypothetical protein M422DRAFT_37206 [Sphaerobolus stellatus SS14]
MSLLSRADDQPDQPAVCTDATANWTFNQKGVSPCDLAASIDHVCFPSDTAYPWLLNLTDQNNNAYGGPIEGFSNKCDCSTVQYALMAACAFCQDGGIDPWGVWSANCSESDISIASFPLDFDGTDIPIWAFVNLTGDNQWLPSREKLLAGTAPDLTTNPTTPIALPGATSSTSSATPSSTISKNSPTHTGPSSKLEGGKSHKGAIAGGVLGVIAGLVLLGLGAFFVRRHLLRKRGPRSSTIEPYSPYDIEPFTPPSSASTHQSSYGHSHHRPMTMNTLSNLRVYDPSDPSTYPSLVLPQRLGASSDVGSSRSPPPAYMSDIGGPRRSSEQVPLMGYKGRPEV